MELEGKVALVTGAGSGIGLAISKAFVAEGAQVLMNDLPGGGEAEAAGLGATLLPADLSDPEAVRALARRAIAVHGRVDILVNNAGFQHVSPVEDFPEEVWSKLLQVMLTAPFQLTKYLVPGMKSRGWGRIVNVSSLHGVVASPFKCAYVSAKHGMIGLTRTVALEVAGHGVTVNAICPAYVRTPLVEKQIAAQAQTHGIPESEVVAKVMLEPAAIKHLIEPEEVADFAVFLASERGRSFTGAAHLMDLGWTAR
jgi:3-hydroxybutyrate dehydrogenase